MPHRVGLSKDARWDFINNAIMDGAPAQLDELFLMMKSDPDFDDTFISYLKETDKLVIEQLDANGDAMLFYIAKFNMNKLLAYYLGEHEISADNLLMRDHAGNNLLMLNLMNLNLPLSENDLAMANLLAAMPGALTHKNNAGVDALLICQNLINASAASDPLLNNFYYTNASANSAPTGSLTMPQSGGAIAAAKESFSPQR